MVCGAVSARLKGIAVVIFGSFLHIIKVFSRLFLLENVDTRIKTSVPLELWTKVRLLGLLVAMPENGARGNCDVTYCCLPTMCARALLTLLLLKYCCEHERPNESCSYWMVLFPMECCLYPVVNGAFLPCRAVAMSCGISGILLAKKSIDRQRLKLLHEKNRETYANRWHITLFIKSLCDFDDMTVYTHLHVYQSQIWFYYNIICMSLIRCIILFINITE